MEPTGASSFSKESGAALSTHTFMAEWRILKLCPPKSVSRGFPRFFFFSHDQNHSEHFVFVIFVVIWDFWDIFGWFGYLLGRLEVFLCIFLCFCSSGGGIPHYLFLFFVFRSIFPSPSISGELFFPRGTQGGPGHFPERILFQATRNLLNGNLVFSFSLVQTACFKFVFRVFALSAGQLCVCFCCVSKILPNTFRHVYASHTPSATYTRDVPACVQTDFRVRPNSSQRVRDDPSQDSMRFFDVSFIHKRRVTGASGHAKHC